MKINKNNLIIIFSVSILAVLFIVIPKFYNPNKKIEVDLPYLTSITENNFLSCKALVSSHAIANLFVEHLDKKIIGEVEEGTDEMAIEIKDNDTLIFQTKASLSIGLAEGNEFLIIKNNNEELTAISVNENAVHLISLNKANGLGVWTKGTSKFPIYDTPQASIIYMHCI